MDFGGQCQSYNVEKHYFPAIEDLAINFIILFLKLRRNRQTLWGGCTDANPKLLLNDT